MAKAKAGSKGDGSGKQRHIKARISYLYRAAGLLAELRENHKADEKSEETAIKRGDTADASSGILKGSDPSSYPTSRHLSSQLRSVSLKSQVRLDGDIKHHVCKRCSTLLLEGRTSQTVIENDSRDRRKPWADVKVVKCRFCGVSKRFPVGMSRQRNRIKRQSKDELKETVAVDEPVGKRSGTRASSP